MREDLAGLQEAAAELEELIGNVEGLPADVEDELEGKAAQVTAFVGGLSTSMDAADLQDAIERFGQSGPPETLSAWVEANCSLLADGVCDHEIGDTAGDDGVGAATADLVERTMSVLEDSPCAHAFALSRPPGTEGEAPAADGPLCDVTAGIGGPPQAEVQELLQGLLVDATGLEDWTVSEPRCADPDLIVADAAPGDGEGSSEFGVAYFLHTDRGWEFRGANASYDRVDTVVVDLSQDDLDRVMMGLGE